MAKHTIQKMKTMIDVARGMMEADLVLRNVRYLDVFSGEWKLGDIAIFEGRIAGVEPLKSQKPYTGKKELNLKGQFLVPGFIDSHVHIESSMMTPDQFQKAGLPRGTTGAIVDPHEIVNVLGHKGFEYILQCAEKSEMDLYVMLSSCVPATNHLETSGSRMSANDLRRYREHPNTLGLAEMMNFPGVLFKDEDVLQKLSDFQDYPKDGHCPMLRGKDLNAYISTGISSCHESVSLEEAQEKLEKGMQVLLREGSVAKNLKDLCSLLTDYSSPKVSLCTDDRNPVDILDEGHMDYLIRLAIKKGIKPATVYRAASWSTANHYGIKNKGAIAPGYDADLVVLKNMKNCEVSAVIKMGRMIKSEKDVRELNIEPPIENSIKYKIPELNEFAVHGASAMCRVIEVIPNQIITNELRIEIKSQDGQLVSDPKKDILKIAVLERHGKGHPLALAFVKGFGIKNGAIGSSVGHDSHNAVTVGTNDADMKMCLEWLKSNGGGFCAIKNGQVLASVPLPIAGLMSNKPLKTIYKEMKSLRVAVKKMGSPLHEPFLQLAFLCLPVIPSLKITDLGLVDVNKFETVSLRI